MVGELSPCEWVILRIDHVDLHAENVKKGTKGFDPDVDRHLAIPRAVIETAKPGDRPEPVAPRAFEGLRTGFFFP
jgi:hypothetical protein